MNTTATHTIEGVTFNGEPLTFEDIDTYDLAEPHCFVCGRHTDHFGEHDDLVEAGVAAYHGGDVHWTVDGEARYMDAFTAAGGTYDEAHDWAIAALIIARREAKVRRTMVDLEADGFVRLITEDEASNVAEDPTNVPMTCGGLLPTRSGLALVVALGGRLR